MQVQSGLRTICSVALALLAAASVSAGDECQPHWDNAVGQPGLNHRVRTLLAVDDGSLGSEPGLYAGGIFTAAGGVTVNHIAKWDVASQEWSALGSGMDGNVVDLAVFDDGAGPALYAAGQFLVAGGETVNNIAKWDGKEWSPLSSGMSGQFGPYYAHVQALAVFDDGSGSGPALYAGGHFITAGGTAANRIAKWDGQQWSPLGSGINEGVDWGTVYTMTAFDDGSGPALYVSGDFQTAGGTPANHIARWDGQQWSPLGSGMSYVVGSLTVFDDGSGPALYAGGAFTWAGGVMVNSIAKWDGAGWSALGGGMSGSVQSLAVFNDGSGSGPALYAGGHFDTAGGVPVNHIARWDGRQWAAVGSGMGHNICCPNVTALAVFDNTPERGDGPALYAGGLFSIAGGLPSQHIAVWHGCTHAAVPADLNGDGFVDGSDLLILLSAWGECGDPGNCPADLNNDGFVDGSDLLILLSSWG